tara:strand:- start:261 stop:443 length:183 start_codon:yes stop_codon:yes gene_type:complete
MKISDKVQQRVEDTLRYQKIGGRVARRRRKGGRRKGGRRKGGRRRRGRRRRERRRKGRRT